MTNTVDEYWMKQAITQAQAASEAGEVPVGAVVVVPSARADRQITNEAVGHLGKMISEAHNQPISAHDPSAHAELLALRLAAQTQENYRLPEATIYTTLEPCLMCAGAMVHARVRRLVYGASEPKAGVVESHPILGASWLNHRLEVTGGVLAEQCGQLLTDFFKEARQHAK